MNIKVGSKYVYKVNSGVLRICNCFFISIPIWSVEYTTTYIPHIDAN